MNSQIKVDFHCHTSASSDSTIAIRDLITECDRKQITKLAITDHNQVEAGLEAAARWPDRIIPGIEIMTTQGELLAYFVSKPIPKGLSPQETIIALKEQGCLISVSHPFDRWRNGGWKMENLRRLVPDLDAIEIYNAHCLSDQPNDVANDFALKNKLAGTAGSDAHSIKELGTAGLLLPDFHDVESLARAIQTAKIFGHRTPLSNRIQNRMKRIFHP